MTARSGRNQSRAGRSFVSRGDGVQYGPWSIGAASRLLMISFVLWAAASPGLAADDHSEEGPQPSQAQSDIRDRSSTTQHLVEIDGKRVAYTATAGTLVLRDEDGAAKASIFYIAYTRDGVSDRARRPLTFSFNGGPGSSSVWLHLGLYGPRRVLMDDEGRALPPPYRLVDNEYSLLDVSDFVFIDPVTTGYSRAAPGEDDGAFHGVEADIEAVGEFIRLYCTRNGRWSSPKFLAGESYGTTRAAGLVGHLQSRHGMYFNGVMLVSSILNFATARFDVGNDLPYVLFLPTYTATAWYHKKLDAGLQADLGAALEQAETFALDTYAAALMRGDRLDAATRERVADQLARLTGLSPAFVRSANLRVRIDRFVKELQRDRKRTTGRLDSRFSGWDRDSAGEGYEFDPSYAAIQGPFTGTLNDYVREELKFESDIAYEILSGRVWPWSFDAENRYLNVAETLRSAMTQNPALQVYVASGYYDLATPYFATDYTFDHLGLPEDLRGNVRIGYYESGHMMYIHKPSLVQCREEMKAFIEDAVP